MYTNEQARPGRPSRAQHQHRISTLPRWYVGSSGDIEYVKSVVSAVIVNDFDFFSKDNFAVLKDRRDVVTTRRMLRPDLPSPTNESKFVDGGAVRMVWCLP